MSSDRELILACIEGRNEAFAELVDRYQDRLYNAIYRMVGNEDDACDVMQDTLVNAYAALATFRGDSEWFTWLYRIAVNAALSIKRKQLLLLGVSQQDPGGGGIDPADPSQTSNPAYQMQRTEEERVVQKALNRLSKEHRLVLILKEIDELTYEEIADIVRVPVGTIRSRLHRARLKLREWLMEEE